jgi:hypothetical protein
MAGSTADAVHHRHQDGYHHHHERQCDNGRATCSDAGEPRTKRRGWARSPTIRRRYSLIVRGRRQRAAGQSRLRPSYPANVVANIIQRGDRTKDGTSDDDPHDTADHRSPGTACTPSRFRGEIAIVPTRRHPVDSKSHNCQQRRHDDGGASYGGYDGEWRDDKKNGRGAELLADGSRYDGEWRDNIPNGLGTAVYPNGQSFNGAWVAGCYRYGNQIVWVDVLQSSRQ